MHFTLRFTLCGFTAMARLARKSFDHEHGTVRKIITSFLDYKLDFRFERSQGLLPPLKLMFYNWECIILKGGLMLVSIFSSVKLKVQYYLAVFSTYN